MNTSGIINDFAGNYALGGGYSGDKGPATAAKLSFPYAVAMDAAGNIYIADGTENRVRKVDVAGTITTFAGNGTRAYYGDGLAATAAELNIPQDVAVDGTGNVYIADDGNARIRMVNPAGIITTFAGTGSLGYTGDGGPATAATLDNPQGVAVDAIGNVYISDADDGVVRKVNTSGIISTIVGTGTLGATGDGGPATAAELNDPVEIRVDCGGNLYIPDFVESRVRKVTYDHAPYFMGGHAQYLTLCAAATVPLNAQLAATDIDTLQTAIWSLLLPPAHGVATVGYAATTTRSLLTPSGLLYTPATGYSGYDTFSVIVKDCGQMADTTTIYVHVSTGPTIDTIAGPAGLCLGTPVILTDDTTGGAWGVTNALAAVTGGVVTGFSAGIDTITYSKTNACGTTTILHPLAINNTPVAGAISGPGYVCTGIPVTLTDPAPGGVWSSGNTDATVSGGIVTGITAGVDMISYTVTNYCGAAYATASVLVSSAPDAGAIAGAGSVCVAAAITLSDAATGGVWNSSNGDASVSGGVVTGKAAGIDTISYFVTNVCGAATATHTLTVLPLPYAGAITGLSTLCVGATITLTDAADSAGVWSSSNPDASVTAGVVTGVATGIAVISYSVTNSCGTVAALHAVTMSSFIPVTGPITGDTTEFCAGGSLTLTEASTGGVWSSSNGSAYVLGGVVTGLSGGKDTISYTITNGCGSAMSAYVVMIDPLPNAGRILGLNQLCQGSTITLGDDVTGGAWSSSNGSIAGVSNGIVTGLSAGTVFVSYTTTNACGNSTVKIAVTVLSLAECKEAAPLPIAIGTQEREVLSVFPDPNSGMFTVSVSSVNDEAATVVITNMVGQRVKELSGMTNANIAVQLSQPAGIYFISVTTAQGVVSGKVVVE